MKIDTSTWKEYSLDDIFALKGGFYNKKPEHSIEGNIPFLASTESNNGTTEYYSIDDIKSWDKVGNEDDTLKNKIYDGNCIAVTVDGSVCNAFYQKADFTCSHSITALYLKNHIITSNIAMFLCTIIMKDKYRWSYGRKPHDVKKFGKSVIKLPTTSTGEPDWQYMEDFVGGLHSKPITTSVKSSHIPLETEKWKEYRVGDLFTVEIAKSADLGNLEEGWLPFVGRTNIDNGVQGYVEPKYITQGNCITISMVGTNFATYQAKNFQASQNIAVLRNNNINLPLSLFISTLLNSEMNLKYSYGRTVGKENITNILVKLPTTPSGEPDWEYMEEYIKGLPYGDKLGV